MRHYEMEPNAPRVVTLFTSHNGYQILINLAGAAIVLLVAMLLTFLVGRVAHAAPPPNADMSLAPWYQSLQTKDGASCCGLGDCKGPKDYPVRIIDGGYEVWIDQQWMKVPPNVVSDRTDNPTGNFITCVQENYWESGTRMPRVLCFFKAPAT